MAIVKMKRLRLIALAEDRDALLESLLHVGCVEVQEPSECLADEAYAALLKQETAHLAEARGDVAQLKQALDVLHKYAPAKGSLFAQRPQVREAELLDEAARREALGKAAEINAHAKTVAALNAREARLKADVLSLKPWSDCDLPLEMKGTGTVDLLLGAIPVNADCEAMVGTLDDQIGAVEVRKLSADREQQYLEILVHKSCRQEALEIMRSYGFAFTQLKDLTGTAEENILRLEQELREVDDRREQTLQAIRTLSECRDELKLGIDRTEQVLAQESSKERLMTGGAIIYLTGWATAPEVPALEKTLAKFDCAYELADPTAEEYPQVPIKLKNNPVTEPFNVVTEMYSMPAYDSVDANPLMAPFFVLFFGFMMNDIAYGLLMVLGTAFFLKKAKPKGGMRNMMTMFLMCGVSSIFWGCITGSFFGDFFPKLFQLLGVSDDFVWFWPPLFSPINDIILVMVGSMVLGVIQIFTGMAVSVAEKFRHKQALDAVTQEFAWWFILFGAAGAIAGSAVAGMPAALGTVGIVLLVGGAVLLLAGCLIRAKGLVGGLIGFGGAIYNGVSGYFSDILSYLRLMALMMAGSIIASVFNTLGSVFGLVPFLILALLGNALNLVLNLLGCYVHTLRLQCLEFFGRFYQDGGKAFRPLAVNTKYVDILKEEN